MFIHPDLFSSGQVGSKIWMAEQLEQAYLARNMTPRWAWILAGWQGSLGLLLLSRPFFKDLRVRSFDIDPACAPVADRLNENWVWRDWQFKAFTADVHTLSYGPTPYEGPPDLVINTSVEHMTEDSWWQKIPSGMIVALQACDLNHADHTSPISSLQHLIDRHGARETWFSGEMAFCYPDKSFTRFMWIGRK